VPMDHMHITLSPVFESVTYVSRIETEVVL